MKIKRGLSLNSGQNKRRLGNNRGQIMRKGLNRGQIGKTRLNKMGNPSNGPADVTWLNMFCLDGYYWSMYELVTSDHR